MSAPDQSEVNRRFYRSPLLLLSYLRGGIAPAEAWFLDRLGASIAGSRVVELGCGTGRITRKLLELTPEVTGIDISPAMIAFCRRRLGRGRFLVGDLRQVHELVDGRFGVVVAAANVLDVLPDAQRRAVLGDLAALLLPDGILYFSTHNRRSRRAQDEAAAGPTLRRTRNPYRQARALVSFALGKLNHPRMARYQEHHEGYAILNDDAHGWRLLHYYVDRDAQAAQLRAAGLDLVHVVSPDGVELAPGDDDSAFTELHYVAVRR